MGVQRYRVAITGGSPWDCEWNDDPFVLCKPSAIYCQKIIVRGEGGAENIPIFLMRIFVNLYNNIFFGGDGASYPRNIDIRIIP